jgi:hypothetical protein
VWYGDRFVMIRAHNVPDKFVNPAISVRVAFRAEDMSMAVRWAFLRFNDEECVSVFFLVICFSPISGSLLAPNLSASDGNRAEVCSAPL